MWLRHHVQANDYQQKMCLASKIKVKTIEMQRSEDRRRMKAVKKIPQLMRELKIKVQFMQWKPMIDAFDRKSYAILIHDVFLFSTKRKKKKKEKNAIVWWPACAESNISTATMKIIDRSMQKVYVFFHPSQYVCWNS